MRRVPVILFVALCAGGCASRLPVGDDVAATHGGSRANPRTLPVPKESVTRFLDRASATGDCFLRCGLQEACKPVEAEEEFLRHELALFLGYTWERGDGGLTVGLDYAYWLKEWMGVGAFVDFVAGDIEAFAAGVGVWLRPFMRAEGITFFVGPGFDLSNEEEEEGAHEESEGGGRSWEARALLRLGVLYAIDLGRGFRLLPSFYYDVILPDERAYVIGLTIGKEF